MKTLIFISLLVASKNVFAESFIKKITDELLLKNGVRVTPYKTEIHDIKNSEANIQDYRAFLEGLKKSLNNERLNCFDEPHIIVRAENWNMIDSNYFGADIEYDIQWMTGLNNSHEITVGNRSYKKTAKELKKLCDFEKNNQHIFNFFRESKILITTSNFSFKKAPSLENQISFITILYHELLELEYKPKKTNLIIINIEVENNDPSSRQFNRWGSDLYEKDMGDLTSIVVGHKSYKELAQTLVKYY